jgi:uncharacterized protein with GYD domain
MPHYVHLIRWTDKGISSVKDSPKRAEAARKAAQQMGGSTQLWYTMGKYDIIGFSEFPDDAAAAKFAFWVGSLGNVRTTTIKAWSEEEASKLIGQLP